MSLRFETNISYLLLISVSMKIWNLYRFINYMTWYIWICYDDPAWQSTNAKHSYVWNEICALGISTLSNPTFSSISSLASFSIPTKQLSQIMPKNLPTSPYKYITISFYCYFLSRYHYCNWWVRARQLLPICSNLSRFAGHEWRYKRSVVLFGYDDGWWLFFVYWQ